MERERAPYLHIPDKAVELTERKRAPYSISTPHDETSVEVEHHAGVHVELTPKGNTCTVPDEDIAKVSYYIHCVDSLFDLPNSLCPRRLTDWNHATKLSKAEKDHAFALAAVLNPDVLTQSGVLVLDETIERSTKSHNKFFDVSATQINGVSLSQGERKVTIGGVEHQTKSIMAYDTYWVTEYFYEPMKALFNAKRAEKAARLGHDLGLAVGLAAAAIAQGGALFFVGNGLLFLATGICAGVVVPTIGIVTLGGFVGAHLGKGIGWVAA